LPRQGTHLHSSFPCLRPLYRVHHNCPTLGPSLVVTLRRAFLSPFTILSPYPLVTFFLSSPAPFPTYPTCKLIFTLFYPEGEIGMFFQTLLSYRASYPKHHKPPLTKIKIQPFQAIILKEDTHFPHLLFLNLHSSIVLLQLPTSLSNCFILFTLLNSYGRNKH
jgi:hypothetical protein